KSIIEVADRKGGNLNTELREQLHPSRESRGLPGATGELPMAPSHVPLTAHEYDRRCRRVRKEPAAAEGRVECGKLAARRRTDGPPQLTQLVQRPALTDDTGMPHNVFPPWRMACRAAPSPRFWFFISRAA